MGKKIGILTFHYALNYGAVLQAVALSRACESLGHDVEIINYYSRDHERANRIITDKKRGFLKSVIYMFAVLPYYRRLKNKTVKFTQFQKEMLSLSHRYETSCDLIKNLPPKDVYITGSDQVFNPVSSENIKVYYLDFEKQVGCKKIAYAPSFGISTLDDALANRIERLLLDFDHLSCREDDGAAFISRVIGKRVQTVLDPVFLISADEWNHVSLLNKAPSLKREPYIFVYDLNGRDGLISIAQKIRILTGLPIVCLTTKKYLSNRYKVDELIIDAGPREFLSLTKGSTYVLTDSFHGVAFSLIFKKAFIAYNALPKASQRIGLLLNKLGLNERFVDSTDIEGEHLLSVLSQKKDYESELSSLILSSKLYLENSVS